MNPCLSCSRLRRCGDCNYDECEVYIQLMKECQKENISFDLDYLYDYLNIGDFLNDQDENLNIDDPSEK